MFPEARQDNLVVRTVGDEVVVYDVERGRAHRLNRTTALVWQQCDGRTAVAAIVASLATTLQLPADERIVWLALRQLDRAGLLRDRGAPPKAVAQISRRQAVALGLVGAASLLLPGCESVDAPTPLSVGVSSAVSPAEDLCERRTPPNCSGGECPKGKLCRAARTDTAFVCVCAEPIGEPENVVGVCETARKVEKGPFTKEQVEGGVILNVENQADCPVNFIVSVPGKPDTTFIIGKGGLLVYRVTLTTETIKVHCEPEGKRDCKFKVTVTKGVPVPRR